MTADQEFVFKRRVARVTRGARHAAIHFLSTGEFTLNRPDFPAHFSLYEERLAGRLPAGFPEVWRTREDLSPSEPARVAVVLNCFYVDLLPELFDRLHSIPVPFDLFITNVSGESIDPPRECGQMRHCAVVDLDNHGRDILPLVSLVNSGLLDPYELILKIHTKKSPWRENHSELAGTGAQWKDAFLDSLLGDEESVAHILANFASDSHLGLVTAPGNIVGPEHWGGDQEIVKNLLRRIELGLQPESLQFAAGSMYWIRGFILQGLRSFNLIADDFETEQGQVDGTTAHGIERIIGIVTKEAGLTLHTTDDLDDGLAVTNPDLVHRYHPAGSVPSRADVVPFYLPQFHAFEENDQWWGKGFTEWNNVAAAVPMYRGHYQPKIPTDMGFYDLHRDEVRKAQAELAAEHGLAGFMYYYYWFSGKRLMSMPIERLKESEINFPFCIMWANENWTRRWDGRSADILIAQEYERVPAADFIDDVMEFLKDSRYLRVNGEAVLAVYRPGQMADFDAVARQWRERARQAGVGELRILAVTMPEEFDAVDAASTEVDGTLEFPPHALPWSAAPAHLVSLDKRWKGNFISYQSTAEESMLRARGKDHTYFPGAMVNFDNTARRQFMSDVWFGSNPYTFHRWVSSQIDSLMTRERSERLMFINAWNEWAEGAILEPTTRFGRTFLLALRNAIQS
ncbi:glycoside hydrolase family 99-like domain-containing protein [Actinomyces vulturis]|uniref:glycoside hydrolase family 99-like domain-containing protein n=1 Tax=Actinomyces vulturis TaxID=1857645 RepID=UPI0008370BA5|nr:glycoside hydrolase family 99-like domain-containing protein [Actinomyces vulturis]